MKKIFKKNQIIITALALMIAVAGYINYSDHIKKKNKTNETSQVGNEVENNDVGDPLSEPGTMVLASSETSQYIINAKMKREQVRAQDKETYLSVINNLDLPDESKQQAVANMTIMADNSEKELAAELLLEAKGFGNAIVCVASGNVDVVVESNGLSDTDKAQIEDIVTRKTNCSINELTITTVAPAGKVENTSETLPEESTDASGGESSDAEDETQSESQTESDEAEN